MGTQNDLIYLPQQKLYAKPTALEQSRFKQNIRDLLTVLTVEEFVEWLSGKVFITPEEGDYLVEQLRRATYWKVYGRLKEFVFTELVEVSVYCSGHRCVSDKYRNTLWYLTHLFCRIDKTNHYDTVLLSGDDFGDRCYRRYFEREYRNNTLPSGIICFENPFWNLAPSPGKPGEFLLVGGRDKSHTLTVENESGIYRDVLDVVVLDEKDNRAAVEWFAECITSQYRDIRGRHTPLPNELAEMDKKNVLYVCGSVVSMLDIKAIVTTEDGLIIHYFSPTKAAQAIIPIGDDKTKEFICKYLSTKIDRT